MTTKITKIITEPVQVIKKTGKELIKPAKAGNVYAIAGGVAVSPIISLGYGKLVDYLITLLPDMPNWLRTAIKLLFPLAPVPIIAKYKVPFGAVINGVLLGIFFTQVGMLIYEVITGTALFSSKKVVSDKSDVVDVVDITGHWGVQE